jgi:hypothetical protein
VAYAFGFNEIISMASQGISLSAYLSSPNNVEQFYQVQEVVRWISLDLGLTSRQFRLENQPRGRYRNHQFGGGC